MNYRRFGKLDWQPSALGFGCMRLPTTDGKSMSAAIDETEAIRMIRRAIDQGVNYVDTAYVYHGGRSETITGKALGDGFRQKVRVATKSPVWLIKETADFDKYLAEQLQRLDTDHIDFYLLHGLGSRSWRGTVLKLNLLQQAEKALHDGRIGHLGFSFHDRHEAFLEIVDGYDRWTFCQIQYNYLDIENQAGTAGLKHAAAKGLAVVVMEPLLGGKLARPPAPVKEMLAAAAPPRAPAEWALQWIWDQPEVSLLLSGMSTMEQVEQNLASAGRSATGSFTAADQAVIARVREAYRGLMPIRCTRCHYCMPCPNGVAIPQNFDLYNDGFVHQDLEVQRHIYERFLDESERAGACTGCKACEEKCPQQLPISDWMTKVRAVLGEGKPYPQKEEPK